VADNLLGVKRSLQETTEKAEEQRDRKVDEIMSCCIMYLKMWNCERRREIKPILHSANSYLITA